jgi:6-phosphogluconolactonase
MFLLNRRRFLVAAILAGLSMTTAAQAQLPVVAPQSSKFRVYIGTYSGAKSKGIYVSDFDAATGKLSKPQVAAELTNPSFVAIDPQANRLYAVGEVADFQGKKEGVVSSLEIDEKTGKLRLINQESSGGAGPCHVGVSPDGKVVAAANYGGGSVCSLAVGKDGKLESRTFIQHEGKGGTPRQTEPHAHSINFSADGKFALAADLGLDKILQYKVNERGELSPNDPPFAKLPPGSGPRHFAFHPSGKYAFVINEMNMTMTPLKYDAEKGTLTPLETVSTVPEGTKGDGLSTAEVQVHPSGKFVYGSNRGHDTIAVFQFDEKTGKLKLVQNQGEGIKTPRNFGIDPTGRFALVANQSGDSVIVFKINQDSGELTPTEEQIEVGTPVCVKFLAVE